MTTVKVRENESLDIALRRYKRELEKTGIQKEVRRRETHQKRSAVRRRKFAAACKRVVKRRQRELQMFGGANKYSPQARIAHTARRRTP